MLVCPIDGIEFHPYPDMRTSGPNRLPWCKKCQDEFDSIDWEEVTERRNNCYNGECSTCDGGGCGDCR